MILSPRSLACFFSGTLLFLISCHQKISSVRESKSETIQPAFERDSTGYWTDLPVPAPDSGSGTIRPESFRLLQLDVNGMKRWLFSAPKEKDRPTVPGLFINIPFPEGTYQAFRIYETEVMAPELAARYPEIKSFSGSGIADPSLGIRLDFSPAGFRAMILTPKGAINIDPYSRPDLSRYICYYKQDFNREPTERMPVDSVK